MFDSPDLPTRLGPDAAIYLRPHPIFPRTRSDGALHRSDALPLAEGGYAFSGCEVLVRDENGINAGFADLSRIDRWRRSLSDAHGCVVDEQLDRLTRSPSALDGIPGGRPRIMGVINATPDSFYAGSRTAGVSAAIDAAREMVEAGADVIDVGGESTRPDGALPVGVDEEISRVVPVIEALADLPAPISIDTRHARVMSEGVAAGASMINDISALTGEESMEAAAAAGVPVILMHCPAEFLAMHRPTRYGHVALDVFDWLARRIDACGLVGLPRERVIVDPGIGFAKQAPQSSAVLARVSLLHALGCPVLVGASRKSFIGRLAGGDTAEDRLPGSLAAALWARSQGVQMLRVHDVAETRQALALQASIDACLTEGTRPYSLYNDARRGLESQPAA